MEVYSQRDPGSAEEDAYQSSRKETIRADIARRLKRICSNLSDEDFDDLVDVIADNKIKGDRRTTL